MEKFINNLNQVELDIIYKCMRIAESKDVFEDWEFDTIFGMNKHQLKNIADQWPNIDTSNQESKDAVIGSLAHLLAYPHNKWDTLPITSEAVKNTLDKVLMLYDK